MEKQCFSNVREYQTQDKLNIVFAGNIGKVQDFDCLVKAVSLIPQEKRKNLKFTIIGSGSYLQNFKDLVKSNCLEDLFEFVGRKKSCELIEYYDKASLFLLSLEKGGSLSKTIPSKLQTYMAAGRGIIGSIDGDATKIIEEAKAGQICSAGDFQMLGLIILDLLDNDEKLIEYAKNSRDYFINNFTIEKCVSQIQKRMGGTINDNIER